MLALKNLTVKARGKIILRDISFNFKKGKIYALMGPNGSGKSTLAYVVMGHPEYKIEKGKIELEGKNINDLTADQRAKLGLFLSFQTPLSLAGVNIFQLLRLSLSGKKDPLTIKKEIEVYARQLKISPDLLQRSLNDGASGGEKKKLEVLQAVVLSPRFLVFDEVDTGVDIDALKIIAKFINRYKKDKTYLLITHYNRILKYLKPDFVLVMIGGKLVKVGDYKLAFQIEKKGYEKLRL